MKQVISLSCVVMVLIFSCKKDKKASLVTISTTAVTNVTATSVKTGGNITDDGGSTITKRGICWATHSNPTVADSITNDGTGGGAYISSLENLNSNTTYYIKAYAINGTGTAYGNEVSFTTSLGLATVTTTAINNIVALSAKSGGNISNDGGASVTARGVVWSTSPNPTVSNFKTADGTGVGTFTSTMSPLASQTTYYVRAYATNSYGISYGDQVQFNAASANTVTDVEGNVYPYVTLCGKNWMATNLKGTKYRNGDAITNGTTSFNWSTATTGAYAFPNNNVNKKDTFGLLYNMHVINDSRGVCPTGWHVPSDNEWKALEICQGMTQADADAIDFRGTIGDKFLEGGSSGLNLNKPGLVFPTDGGYYYFGDAGLYWSATSGPIGTNSNFYRAFNLNGTSGIYRNYGDYVISVRCVKD